MNAQPDPITAPAAGADTPVGSQQAHAWFDPFWRAYGARGVVALAWWTGSLMSQQLRERQKSFPILAITGGAGVGKTSLVEFLQSLVGRPAFEGTDPSLATRAALSRVLYEPVNRPVVLVNCRGGRLRGVPTAELLAAYNGTETGEARAVVQQGRLSRTVRMQFKGGLAVVQDEPWFTTPALAARSVELVLCRANHTPDGRAAVTELDRLQQPKVSEFVAEVERRSDALVELHALCAPAAHEFFVKNMGLHERIAYNHAQLRALLDVLAQLLPITSEQYTQAVGVTVVMAAAAGQALLSPAAQLAA
jgi:hypothetical protein